MIILQVIIILLFLLTVEKVILMFQYKIMKHGEDHPIHVSLIQSIKKNKHRFIKHFHHKIPRTDINYPQFFHWILSFFPEKFIKEKFRRVGQTINFLNIVSFIFFASSIYSLTSTTTSYGLFIFYSGLIFVVSPFNFYLWNAKNRGLSVRGFGLLLTFWYQYFIIWQVLFGNSLYYFPIYVLAVLILLSSQFAFQFIMFSSFLFAFAFHDIFLLFPPFVAIGLFLFLGGNLSKNFIKGQYLHKKIMFKYYSRISILKERPSIYRDFIFDFWGKKNIKYFLNNSIISVIIGFPFLIAILGISFYNKAEVILVFKEFFFFPFTILISLVLFVLTSFRFSRFLGEPERYVEFSLPFISLLSVILFQHETWLILSGLIFSFLIILHHFFLFGFRTNEPFQKNIFDFRNTIKTIYPQNQYLIFSNATFLLNFFIDDDKFVALYPNASTEYTGKYHFKEIFQEEYFKVNPDIILPLIYEFKINWFILHTYWLSEKNLEKENESVKLVKEKEIDSLILYRVFIKG